MLGRIVKRERLIVDALGLRAMSPVYTEEVPIETMPDHERG